MTKIFKLLKRVSLPKKIFAIAFVPLAFFVYVTAQQVMQERAAAESMELSKNMLEVANKGAELVGKIQLERGVSVSTLSGAASAGALAKRRDEVDLLSDAYLAFLKESHFPTELKTRYQDSLESLPEMRSKVDQKSVDQDAVVSHYTSVIKTLILSFKDMQSFEGGVTIYSNLSNILEIEYAKENAGVFRAQLSVVLAEDESFGTKVFSGLTSKMGAMVSFLGSPALSLDEKGAESIDTLLSGDEMEEVQIVYADVLANFTEGDFGWDADDFFVTATELVEGIGEISTYERSRAMEKLSAGIAEANAQARFAIALAVGAIALILFGSLFLIRDILGSLNGISRQLELNSSSLGQSANQTKVMSQNLSGTASSLASTVRQCAASVAEISAMVSQNSENTRDAASKSDSNVKNAIEGKESVELLLKSVRALEKANNTFASEMKTNNEKVQGINDVINSIEQKTSVINDIVFQTKLLSFNASVEAARAGESGKGFAVVAEEIANLAQMSGVAADEIKALLQESTKHVDQVIKSSTENTDRLLQESADKIAESVSNVETSQSLLNTIEASSGELSTIVESIGRASTEQESGLKEIETAISTVDSSANETSAAAEESLGSSEQIQKDAGNIMHSVEDVKAILGNQSNKKSQKLASVTDITPDQYKKAA